MTPPPEIVAAAVEAARHSPCAKSKRGVVVWFPMVHSEPPPIVIGFNAPALGTCDGSEGCRRDCASICVHAEQAALLAPWRYRARGAELLHIKVVDGVGVPGKAPCCAECSKMIVASGIAGVWLWELGAGWGRYPAADFHRATLRNLGLHECEP